MKLYKACLFVFLLILPTMSIASDNNLVSFDSHNIYVTLDVENQSATIKDNGTIIVTKGLNYFYLNSTASIESFTLNSQPTELNDLLGMNLEEGTRVLKFESDNEGNFPFSLVYTGIFNDDVENVRFSNESVGQEVNATINNKGAFLSPSSYYYPQGNDTTGRFSLTANIPSNWESVADGNKMEQRQEDDRKIQTWTNPYMAESIMFMAAPYVVKETTYKDISIACYFFAEDTSLFDGYLSATVGYMEMYTEMFGNYPFKNFTIAENFFPTGSGMPGWTLLGQQVIRLPFIKHTSLGHEVLHNWWGNSVYVDYERGNWCESAAVYGADYRYKLMRSESAALNYRKDILKQYISYVNEGNDFPVREFISRSSKDTRTIGYQKAMMIYHMIEKEIGSDAFWKTWKNIYTKYLAQKIAWEEWIAEFEKASGENLAHIIPQWIDQAGAPVLSVSDVITKDEQKSKRVTFKLSESSGQDYTLQVPVRFSGTDTKHDTVVTLSNNEQIYQLVAPATTSHIEVDPDFHLFRRLYDEEIEPIISAVTGNDSLVYATDISDSLITDMFTQFGDYVEGNQPTISSFKSLENAETDYALILLNPKEIPSYLSDKIKIENDSLQLISQKFPIAGHSFILSGDNLKGYKKYLVVITEDYETLPRMGQLIPHYGKYSYLVFEGDKNVAKGQWEIESSPLKVGF